MGPSKAGVTQTGKIVSHLTDTGSAIITRHSGAFIGFQFTKHATVNEENRNVTLNKI